ncbi:helix-turn-helix domain-containing protein [Spirillospora sp. NPDC000708]
MSRYRLCPTPAQEAGLLEHCRHARFVWNLPWSSMRGGRFAEAPRQAMSLKPAS